MIRIPPVNLETAEPRAEEILEKVRAAMGAIPNLIATMAQSPSIAEAYLGFSNALSSGVLDARLRERLALMVGEANGCHYCVSAHTVIGSKIGLSDEEIVKARQAKSKDEKADAALQFALKIVQERGQVSDDDVNQLRDLGFGNGEIGEIVAHVAMNTFSNYFNNVAGTDIDFPLAQPLPR